jgi:hypothetical protein
LQLAAGDKQEKRSTVRLFGAQHLPVFGRRSSVVCAEAGNEQSAKRYA